jgi:hypothetical protein
MHHNLLFNLLNFSTEINNVIENIDIDEEKKENGKKLLIDQLLLVIFFVKTME